MKTRPHQGNEFKRIRKDSMSFVSEESSRFIILCSYFSEILDFNLLKNRNDILDYLIVIRSFQASYGRREIEIAEQEMPGIMALRKKASVSDMIWVKMVVSENHVLDTMLLRSNHTLDYY